MKKFLPAAANTAEVLEKGVCYGALGLMALAPAVEILIRPFGGVFPASRGIMTHLFLVVGLFAAMITTKTNEHISIAVVQYVKNERLKTALAVITSFISVFVVTVLFWDSLSFLRYGLSGRPVGFIPDRIFAAAMPVGYGVMAFRFARFVRGGSGKPKALLALAILSVLLGTVSSLPAIAKLVWNTGVPEPFFTWVNMLYDAAGYARTPVILLLIAAALSGTPIFAVIGGIALIMLQAKGGEPEVAAIQIYSALTEADIIAIPLFTLTGFFLSESKAGERLVHAFRSLFSWLPGGIIIATVVICAFFTSFTGASGVTILALGGILYTILTEKSKYPDRFSIGLLTSVGGIGLLFPPSLPIILVASTTNSILYFMGNTINHNIVDFFLGAIIPGVILVAAMIVFGIVASVKIKIPLEPFSLREAGKALKGSILEILLPLILIAGYFSGLFSLVQISALSVIYVFIAEVLINNDIALKDVKKVFFKAVPIIGGVLSILAMAKALSYAIIDAQIPENFALWMRATVSSKYLFLLLLNLALLVVGCLMDIFSAILVVLPLIVPLGQAYGIDPIHLGIIFIINLEVGFLTPPVGMNLFLASYRFKRPFMEICRFVLPFLLIQLAVVFLVTYLPDLSLFLPRLF
ncbi:MAG: TRAP transporter large permease subunit [Treponema sp.]|jgi:tripartite ATP-independent transporter DctM subunit|nr:TRAP transporter large permease subunit [Treponema sp.]